MRVLRQEYPLQTFRTVKRVVVDEKGASIELQLQDGSWQIVESCKHGDTCLRSEEQNLKVITTRFVRRAKP